MIFYLLLPTPLFAAISSIHNYDTRHEVVTRDSSG